MKWIYSIQERGKAAAILTAVIVLVSGVTLMKKSNVSELGSSFSSVYEDRLVVESYIYKFSDYLYQKKLVIGNCQSAQQAERVRAKLTRHNDAIRKMITAYEQTKLTQAEVKYFADFKTNISEMIALENNMLDQTQSTFERRKSDFDQEVDKALSNLDQLSSIQLSEGKALNENSKRIIAGSEMLTQFELVVLIIIAVIIQMLIFTSNSFRSKIPQNSDLN
jgi:nitrogen fixation protein FixH